MTAKPNKAWFQQQFKMSGMTARQLAQRLGIGETAFSNCMNGKRKLTEQEATQVAVLLQVPLETLMLNLWGEVAMASTSDLNSIYAPRGAEIQQMPSSTVSWLPIRLSGGKSIEVRVPVGLTLEEWEEADHFVRQFIKISPVAGES